MEVRAAGSHAEVEDALGLRERVFCGEQGVSLEGDRDGLDPQALHLVAVEGERVVGTCRVLVDGHAARFGRLCVDPAARRRGLAARLLDEAERAARRAGARRMRLHAQLAARSLYVREGYRERGAEFVEEDIPHVAMEKDLA